MNLQMGPRTLLRGQLALGLLCFCLCLAHGCGPELRSSGGKAPEPRENGKEELSLASFEGEPYKIESKLSQRELSFMFFDAEGDSLSKAEQGFPRGARKAILLFSEAPSSDELPSIYWINCCSRSTLLKLIPLDRADAFSLSGFNLGNRRHKLVIQYPDGDSAVLADP